YAVHATCRRLREIRGFGNSSRRMDPRTIGRERNKQSAGEDAFAPQRRNVMVGAGQHWADHRRLAVLDPRKIRGWWTDAFHDGWRRPVPRRAVLISPQARCIGRWRPEPAGTVKQMPFKRT